MSSKRNLFLQAMAGRLAAQEHEIFSLTRWVDQCKCSYVNLGLLTYGCGGAASVIIKQTQQRVRNIGDIKLDLPAEGAKTLTLTVML